MQNASLSPDRITRLLRAGFALLILVYFAHFAGPSLGGTLNEDDPMNIYWYWSRGPWQLLRNLPLFFTTYQRPIGGVYFYSLYHFFGLDPFPYHVALVILLLINTFLAYRFGRLVTGSELAGGLTALAAAYHAGMPQLAYQPAFAFDVLCFLFYMLALTYYLSIRSRGLLLGKRQCAAFLLLYVCALDSKEMAVSLPVVVLLWELIQHPPSRLWGKTAFRWLAHEGLPALGGGLLTLVFILGKSFGADALVRMPAYRPAFTWQRYWESTVRFVNEIFYAAGAAPFFNAGRVALLAAAILWAAWRFRSRRVLWLWCFVWVTPLPITFVPGRGGGCLYIPLAGWAALCAMAFAAICRAASRAKALRWLPQRAAVSIVLLAGVALFWAKTERQHAIVFPGVLRPAEMTRSAIEQVRSLQPRIRPGSKVYVLQSPFPGWDMKFIMELVWRDRSVDVMLADKTPLPPSEIERMDYVFSFEDGKLVRLKGA